MNQVIFKKMNESDTGLTNLTDNLVLHEMNDTGHKRNILFPKLSPL